MPLLSVSHRQQRQQSDCLAACAAMILDYLHVTVKYSQLLSLLRIQAFGTSFSSLHNLETLGLSVRIEEGSIANDFVSIWRAVCHPLYSSTLASSHRIGMNRLTML